METKFKSPKVNPTFTAKWNSLIGMVTNRPNFKRGHLYQLEILCDLYVEYEKLQDLVEIKGYSFISDGGRNGPQEKISVEVTQLNRCRADILAYSKHLGLLLVKDSDIESEGTKDEWT